MGLLVVCGRWEALGGGHGIAGGLSHARWSAGWVLVGLEISRGHAARSGAVHCGLAHVHMDITDVRNMKSVFN